MKLRRNKSELSLDVITVNEAYRRNISQWSLDVITVNAV